MKVQGSYYTLRLNGAATIENGFTGEKAAAPIGLRHDGAPIQFANIYVREIK